MATYAGTEWVEKAACADDDTFYERPTSETLPVCLNHCPVRSHCLAYGLRTTSVGVFGGVELTGRESDRETFGGMV